MPKIPIYAEKDGRMLQIEYEAHEMNRQRDLLLSIRNRTMKRDDYYRLTHWLRSFFWGIEWKEDFIEMVK